MIQETLEKKNVEYQKALAEYDRILLKSKKVDLGKTPLVTITERDCDLCVLGAVCAFPPLFHENPNLRQVIFEGECPRGWSDLVYKEGSSQKKTLPNPTL